jgi:hypothetical protein
MTESSYFAFYTCAVITLGFFDQGIKLAADQNNLVVEGEQHYWVHVAIDRFTNQVLDKQIEVVNE